PRSTCSSRPTRRGRSSWPVRAARSSWSVPLRLLRLALERAPERLDPREVPPQRLQPHGVVELPGRLLEPELPGCFADLFLLFEELALALLSERLSLLLLHRISISESRVMKRVARPILSAASPRASFAVARSTPSIS